MANPHLPLDAWTARWIEPAEPDDVPELQRPAHHLATEFRVDQPVRSAKLRVTAHGVYEAFLNGARIGDQELTPGFTAYRKRLQVQTFDVTPLVQPGANAVGALLSDGWWRGQHGIARRTDSYGTTTALLAELHLRHESGAVTVHVHHGRSSVSARAPAARWCCPARAGPFCPKRTPGSTSGARMPGPLGISPAHPPWLRRHPWESLLPARRPDARRRREAPRHEAAPRVRRWACSRKPALRCPWGRPQT